MIMIPKVDFFEEREGLPMLIAAGIILLISVFGIVFANLRLKEKKGLRIALTVICAILAAVSGSYILISVYFAWAVSVN